MMSFMGSIGSMMKGSGLEDVLESIYGPNAASYMMSGKAVSRALCGHFFLAEAALVNKLILAVLPGESNGNGTGIQQYEIELNHCFSSDNMEVDTEPIHTNEVEIADQYKL